MMLRRVLFLLLLCLPLFSLAQTPAPKVILLTKDSLPYHPDVWRFSATDALQNADSSLADSAWSLTGGQISLQHEKPAHGFNGIGWFRLHFISDSTIAGQPILISLWQDGASELYLDGKRIATFGAVSAHKDSVRDENPGPFAAFFTAPQPGHHVLALRYADFNWEYNVRTYGESPGINLELGIANASMPARLQSLMAQHWIYVFFFTLFLSFGMLHLLLFAFHRSDKSNLWFSLFCWSMCLVFLAGYIVRYSQSPEIQHFSGRLVVPLGAAACGTMSGLINSLFSRKRLRFYIIGGCSVAIAMLHFAWWDLMLPALMILISVVALESVIVVIRAIIRRVKGARIVGVGILFFCLFLLFLYVLTITAGGNLDLNDSNMVGALLLLTLCASIISIPVSMSAYLAWKFSRISRDLNTQLNEVERLSAQALEAEAEKQRLLEARRDELEKEVAERTASLRDEKEKSDRLLRNILPAEIAEELKEKGRSDARLYNNVSVLFTDFVDFTQIAERLSPAALVAEIDHCFKSFDDIIERHGLEKIKTVGDAYIAVSGMPVEDPLHARNVVSAALEIRDFIQARIATHPESFTIRLGIHSGPVVAGIVGIKKFAYDIWGDTVNTAARMEQHSEAGKINISAATYELVKDAFQCSFRGELEAKHKGRMGMYFVEEAVAIGL